jgi:membrane protein implicated in regulation of membrane protease activity
MYETILLYLLLGYVLFEIIEHIIWPFIWYFKTRKRRPVCGPESMTGDTVEVVAWKEDHWQVHYNGQLWNAVSDKPLSLGDKAVIRQVNGLTLLVTTNKT